MSSCDIGIVIFNQRIRQEDEMKQWIAEHVLTAAHAGMEETIPISDREFYLSMSMVGIALGLFTIVIRVIGA
jgi:hypothetical protein